MAGRIKTGAALTVVCLALIGALVVAVPSPARELPAQSVRILGTTYARAQVLSWIDASRFAVGRWDGTMSIFRVPQPGEFGPVVVQAMAAPSGRGVEMLKAIDSTTLVASNGAAGMTIWTRSGAETGFALAGELAYDAAFGTANSAAVLDLGGVTHLVTGHENGNVLLWRRKGPAAFDLAASFDLRSPQPIPNPLGLRNIRGLVVWRGDRVVAGSEDGDLVGLELRGGREVFRARYNADAMRGINSLSLAGEQLLVANCSVGTGDKNIWLFDLSTGRPVLRDAENLVLDTQRPQVFNFDAALVAGASGATFFSSTEEGLIWQGRVDGDQLVVTGVTRVAPDGGAVLQASGDRAMVAAAANQIWLLSGR